MSASHLTSKYRPQLFSEVAGQESVKAVLSRAAATDSIAPAYLFSGTRGVGKTTLARILAKAVNCETAPTAEPCNQCRFCRQITAGSCVDVVEIDAASNRGIDDARRLKEDIGYAPLDARYKVFIIDEAHMLTREAFNALLKTLEEPPPHATFILATTEPHKFPATIISRCQHYTFKRLTQAGLEAHLAMLLEKESVAFEPSAVSLIARRGAGSVRDSMSLLSQVLAMGEERLTSAAVRELLGLAGEDIFFGLMEAIDSRDSVRVAKVLRELLDQGLDLGFFLRELAGAWRNMFLLRQAGPAAKELMEATEEEAGRWQQWAERFPLAQIHAAWQLTVEGQRKVLTSLEPALALELLLLNITCLPDLLPLPEVKGDPPRSAGGPAAGGGPAQRPRQASAREGAGGEGAGEEGAGGGRSASPRESHGQGGAGQGSRGAAEEPDPEPEPSPQRPPEPAQPPRAEPQAEPSGPRSWEGFLDYVRARGEAEGFAVNGLAAAQGAYADGVLTLTCRGGPHLAGLSSGEFRERIDRMASAYFGEGTRIELKALSARPEKSLGELRREVKERECVRGVLDEFGARIVDIRRT